MFESTDKSVSRIPVWGLWWLSILLDKRKKEGRCREKNYDSLCNEWYGR